LIDNCAAATRGKIWAARAFASQAPQRGQLAEASAIHSLGKAVTYRLQIEPLRFRNLALSLIDHAYFGFRR
jgi:hypothetical protein